MEPVRILSDEPRPGGRRLITIDSVSYGRQQVLVAPGETNEDAIATMLAMLAQRVAEHHAIVHNGQQ